MDILYKHMNTRLFCDRIHNSSYEQKHQKCNNNQSFSTMIDIFFSNFDHHYVMVEPKDKSLYTRQRLVEIATDIDENKDSKYDNFTYLKCMNSALIQYGLQAMKNVSALLYLSDYYGVTTNIFIESTMLKVVTSVKERKVFNVLYTSRGKWSIMDSESDKFKDGVFDDLGTCLTLDVPTRDIYKKYLLPIGKYKVQQLIDIAKDMNLSLDKDGKKKVKKQLYDDINFYQLNLK